MWRKKSHYSDTAKRIEDKGDPRLLLTGRFETGRKIIKTAIALIIITHQRAGVENERSKRSLKTWKALT